jgi:aspartokinase
MVSQNRQSGSGGVMKPLTFERGRGVYALDVRHDLAHIEAPVGVDESRTERIQRLLRTLADNDIPIFLIKLHPMSVSFALETGHLSRAEDCLISLAGSWKTLPDLSLITVIATSMRDLNDVMVTIADSLQRAGARLYGIGDSHNTVQCLVETAHAEAAARELRAGFGLGESS